jgi:pimeloyl-ACP methyl ester carboxylesterase
MAALYKIEIAPELIFDALIEGQPGAPLVVLLHGFASSMYAWRGQIPALAAAGCYAVAPSQRGYSPEARPDPTRFDNYNFDKLVGDAMDVAAACACGNPRFHLVGHDWGGSLAWAIADRYPERLASLTILSRPHPVAFNKALTMPDGDQARRSQHHQAFLEPDADGRVLADNARWLRERWTRQGSPAAAQRQHLSVIGNSAAMAGALAWYRARGTHHKPVGMTRVPTLYLWGDADDTVGRAAAEGTRDCIAAPYRFEVLPGVGHFAHDQAPDRVTELLLGHLAAHPG